MSAKDILYSTEAREKVMIGVDKLANIVKVTLGPKGRNVIIDKLYSGPRSTKDGVTVAKEVTLKDRYENVGAQLVKQVAIKSGELAGDGTTTSTVLAQAIMREGQKAIASGVNPMDLKRGIEMAAAGVVAHLKLNSKPVESSEQIRQIATISANGDTDIGDMITNAFDQVGRNGQVNIMEGRKLVTELEVMTGLNVNAGYALNYFINNPDKSTCELNDCFVLFSEAKFLKEDQIRPLIEYGFTVGHPLLIVANDVDGAAVSLMVHNKNKGVYQSCAIRIPYHQKYTPILLEDMSIICGGKYMSKADGDILAKHIPTPKEIASGARTPVFGKAMKVIVGHDKATIINGGGDPELVALHKESIKQVLKDLDDSHTVDEEYRKHLVERLSLFDGIAVIRIGGTTELEMKERYDRYDDSLCATRAAIQEGVLPGGGVALVRATSILDTMHSSNEDIQTGIKIMRKALLAPFIQIAANAGVSLTEKDIESGNYNHGYNAQNDSYGDMIKLGIIDPTKVVRIAIENAASVAGMILTTEGLITFAEDVNLPNGPQQFVMTA